MNRGSRRSLHRDNDIALDLQFEDGDDNPVAIAATLTDIEGYTHLDAQGRLRGGSTVTFSWQGVTWVFERQ